MTVLNNIDLYLHLVIIFSFALTVRSLPIILVPPARDFDCCGHIYIIDFIRNNDNKIPKYYPRIPENHRISYPPFLHYLLSFTSKEKLDFVLKFFNPVLDSFFSLLIFLIIWLFTEDLYSSWLGTLVYLFSPLLFSHQAVGPRITNFTPRVFGECLFFLVTFCMLMENNIYVLILGGVISGIIFISSQFSAQVVILTIPLMVLFGASFNILLIPITGIIVASIIGKEDFINAIRDKIKHYKWYISKIFSPQGISIKRTWFVGIFKALKEKSIKNIYKEIFLNNTILILCVKAPLVIYLLYLFNFPILFKPFILASFIIFILTSTKAFLFLGEAERYIVHYYPIIIFASILTIKSEIILYFIVYGIVFYCFDIIMLRYKKKNVPNHHKSNIVINYLNNINETKVVATNPLHLGGQRVLSDTIHDVVGPFNSIYDKNSFFSAYEFLNEKKLRQSSQYYKIDLFFFDTRHLSSIETVRKELANYKESELEYGILLFKKVK